MMTPIEEIEILSIYKRASQRVLLPQRMAKCTPDTRAAILNVARDLEQEGGRLYLSDLFRSYDMQLQAHLDWKTGKKSAYSPPPGGSMHEAGRGFDLDLGSLHVSLERFWEIAAAHGVTPIITRPDSSLSEAWHFDCRGSHDVVYQHYKAGKGVNFAPYKAMAASAILAINVRVDAFGARQKEATLQAGLIRLGFDLGNIDGVIGVKTRAALEQANVTISSVDEMALEVEHLLQLKFPNEYRTLIPHGDVEDLPEHVIR